MYISLYATQSEAVYDSFKCFCSFLALLDYVLVTLQANEQ